MHRVGQRMPMAHDSLVRRAGRIASWSSSYHGEPRNDLTWKHTRPPGRHGSAVAPACLIPRGPAPPAPTYSVARNGSPCPTRIQDRGGAKFCGRGRARFVRVRTEVYTGERGPRPGGTGRAASCAGGLRDIVLRAYAARTPGRIAAGLSGSPPGRIAGGLPWTGRPARSVEALLRTERAVAPVSQPSAPGSRPGSSPRPTRRTAAQGHTGERFLTKRGWIP
jgi:hypothetical protein